MCTHIYVMCVCRERGKEGGGGGGGGWALCALSYTYMLLWMFAFINLFCFPVCVYWCMWVFLHVKRQEHFFGFVGFINIHYYYYKQSRSVKPAICGNAVFSKVRRDWALPSWRRRGTVAMVYTSATSPWAELQPRSAHHKAKKFTGPFADCSCVGWFVCSSAWN